MCSFKIVYHGAESPLLFKTVWRKSNQITFYCHTSALVSEILMSVLQTVQKKPNNLHMDRQCKKNCTGAFTVLQTVQKNNNNNLHMDRQCKKTTNNLHMDRQCKKNCTGAFTVLQTRGRPIIGLADYRRRYQAFYRLSISAILKTDLPIIIIIFF